MKLLLFLYEQRYLLGIVALNQVFSKAVNYAVLPKLYSSYGFGKIYVLHFTVFVMFDILLVLLAVGLGRSLGIFVPDTLRQPHGTGKVNFLEWVIRWLLRLCAPYPKLSFLFVSTQFGGLVALVYFRYIRGCESRSRLSMIFLGALLASSLWSTKVAEWLSPYVDQLFSFVRHLLAF